MSKLVTWILVADGSRAKVFKHGTDDKVELLHETASPHPPSRDIVADRPGRTFDSQGSGRHAKEPPSDAHDIAETNFIRSVADQMETACGKKEFDSLVVIAPPRALGDWRAACSDQLKKAITQEIPKEATTLPTAKLQEFLAQNGVL